jgi:tetratricopeptide (TPR) repeat protein
MPHLRRIALLIVLALAAGAAAADTIQLTNGRTLSGRIVNETPAYVEIEVPYGRMKVPREQIARIDREPPFDYHMGQGDLMVRDGLYSQAIAEYRKAEAEKPDSAAARDRIAVAYVAQGRALLKRGQVTEAERCFTEAKKVDAKSDGAAEGLRQAAEKRKALEERFASAMALAEAGKAADAAAAFEAMASESQEFAERAAPEYAASLARLSEEAYRAGNYAEAARRSASALVMRPDLAPRLRKLLVVSHLNAAGPLIEAGRLDEALALAAEAAAFAPEDPFAQYYVGIIHLRQGKRDEAQRALLRGLAAAGGTAPERPIAEALAAALAARLFPETDTDRIGRLAREAMRDIDWSRVEAGEWQTLDTAHFRIRHRNAAAAKRVGEAAEAWFERIMTTFELDRGAWKERADVFIYPDKESYRKEFNGSEWSGGMTQVRIEGGRITRQRFGTWQTSADLLTSVLPHELTHLVVHSMLKYEGRVPLALHEGIAVWMEPPFKRRHYEGVCARAAGTAAWIPLEKLLAMKDYPSKDQEIFYAESLLVVRRLIEAGGMARFKEFIDTVNVSGIDAGLEKHYGSTAAKMEAGWMAGK